MMDYAYIELLRSMVAIPSTTFNESEVRRLICLFLDSRGVDYGCVKNNILALGSAYDASKPTLMLCAHIDTVPPCEGYGFDPYAPDYAAAARVLGDAVKGGDFVAGLGSNDDGGSVIAMTAVFEYFSHRSDLPFNVMLTLSTEEENSGPDGSRYLWSEYWAESSASCPEFPRPALAIIGEPTGGRAATSERGLLVIDAHASGVSGHAARGEGVNALYIAMDDIVRMREMRFDRHSPVMGDVKLSVTQINAGTAHNVIPDSCRFVVDIRPTEKYTNPEILEMLQSVCKSELKARNLTNRSSATSPDGPLMAAVKASGLETFSSPTTSDWMRTGCDAVKMGPGESSRSHRPNEYILVSEIGDAYEKYIRLIENIKL